MSLRGRDRARRQARVAGLDTQRVRDDDERRSILILFPTTWRIKKVTYRAPTLDQKWKISVKCCHVVRVTVGWQTLGKREMIQYGKGKHCQEVPDQAVGVPYVLFQTAQWHAPALP